jgi:haloalkane dehalogenase
LIPAWVDRREYPFEPRTLDVDGARMSYLDEGEGAPIVMVHGTPTWSFLYRHLIRELRSRYRCVAPDHLGFGLSDRPRGWSYRPEDQAGNLARLIERLALEDLTLVVHDYGGPIGRFLYERLGFSVRVMLRHAVADRRRYTRDVERHYLNALDGHATWVYAREVLGSSGWYDGLWRRRDRIARIPALLIWGLKDPAFGRYLPRWREVFERAEVVELPDCGHAPPEERAPETLRRLAPFLER